MSVASARRVPVERTFADRLLAAVPLLSIFLWLSIVYAVEAWAHSTPWLFGDELELTQLSRAIAARWKPSSHEPTSLQLAERRTTASQPTLIPTHIASTAASGTS